MDFSHLFHQAFFWVGDFNAWVALATLIFLEIVLGIDNLIFLAIIIARLPESKREKARIFGLALAMLSRIALLVSLFWVMKLTKPLFTLWDFAVSGRDIVLFVGGLFLIYKATTEIHAMTQPETSKPHAKQYAAFGIVLIANYGARYCLFTRFSDYRGGYGGYSPGDDYCHYCECVCYALCLARHFTFYRI